MKKASAAKFVLWAVALSALMLGVPSSAQQSSPPLPTTMAQDQTAPQMNASDPAESKTFTGKIVKQGDKLVLTDATGKTVYQLDDQMKAKDFLNKNVKVTGVLDGSTTTIHVSAIDPV